MNISIICSGMTGKIYAVRENSKGSVIEKMDVTKQVIEAVIQHMDITKEEYECEAGDLIFKQKTMEVMQ